MMSMGCPEGKMPIQLENGILTAVDDFTYLSSNITNDREVVNEVGARLGKAAKAFGMPAYNSPSVFCDNCVLIVYTD